MPFFLMCGGIFASYRVAPTLAVHPHDASTMEAGQAQLYSYSGCPGVIAAAVPEQ